MKFMSHDVKFWLEIFLECSDDRRMRIEVSHSISDDNFKTLVKAINKVREKEVDIKPLVKFLKNDELNYLIGNGWSVIDIEFIAHDSQILDLLEERKENGLSIEEAKKLLDHIPRSAILSTMLNLHLKDHTIPVRHVGENGGYILKKYNKQAKFDEPSKEPNKKESSFTKLEAKKIRKSIIDKASRTDICEAGFKPDFIKLLDEKEQKYLNDISNLAIKLMRTEVSKS